MLSTEAIVLTRMLMSKARRYTTMLICVAAAVIAASCRPQLSDMNDAEAERNKGFVRRWIEEGFNRQNLSVVDELFADGIAVNGNVVGRAGLKQSMSRHLAGFPDLHVTIDDIIADEGQVGIWYTVVGTHRGEFEGIPPTGRRVTWVGFDLFTIDNGMISKARFLSDLLGLLEQLGATVTPP